MAEGSIDDMVYQLRHGYWEWRGGLDDHWRKFNFDDEGWAPKDGKLKVHFDEDDPISRDMKDLVKEAFRYVADVLDIKVSFKVADGDDGDVNIHRVDDWDSFFGGTEYAAASADLGLSLILTDRDHYQYYPDISFDNSKFNFDNPRDVIDHRTTFIHELSHLLGLGHLGDYNGGSQTQSDLVFDNDSRGYSLMSYVAPNEYETGRFHFNGKPWTYREVDLVALDVHYGRELSMEERATQWGFDGTVSHDFINENFDIVEQNHAAGGSYAPALTIIDTGGKDTLNLRSSLIDVAVRLDLTPGSYSDILSGKDNLFIHSSSVIENVYSDDAKDHITGNNAKNEVFAGGGNDTVTGGAGRDTLRGEDGDDSLEGEGGNDTLLGGAGQDTLIGGGGKDHLYGGDDADELRGKSGKDTLDGADGFDTLYGDAGRDYLYLGDGGVFAGGIHNDTFAVNEVGAFTYEVMGEGGNRDTLSFVTSGAVGFGLDLENGLLEDLETGSSTAITLTGIERILGSRVDDTLFIASVSGNDLDYVDARGGSDLVYVRTNETRVTGGDQDDTLWVQADGAGVLGGRHNDQVYIDGVHAVVDGERGQDSLTFQADTYTMVAVDAHHALYGYDVSLTALSEEESGAFSRFERIEVESTLQLNFYGSRRGDHVAGGDQDDFLQGVRGNDTFHGGDGADTLEGGTGNDSLFGDAGKDTLIGGAGSDTLFGGEGADRIETGDGNDYAEGGTGNDTVICGDGFEQILGQEGDDLFLVEVGEKQINGGQDQDTLEFLGKSDRIVDLGQQKYQDDFGLTVDFVNIENVITKEGDDSITGDASDNHFWSNGGMDTLNGGGGDDTLEGGAATDLAEFTSGAAVAVDLSAGTAEGEGSDILSGIENITTAGGNDTIIGDASDSTFLAYGGDDSLSGGGGRDHMFGGAGNDTVLAGDGVDHVYGEEGYDTLGFDSSLSGVRFSLANVGSQDTDVGSITASGFEALRGTNGADHLTGDVGDNILSGADGKDTLIGGSGSDTIDGGADADVFVMREGDGDDSYVGGAGLDWLDFSSGGAGVTFRLARGTDDLGTYGMDTWSGVENVVGTKFKDSLVGDAAGNALWGLLGNDTLEGGFGNDTLEGGDGEDQLVGGADNDVLTGGENADTFQFKVGHGQDLITDFDGEEGDKIVIAGAQAYEFTIIDGRLSLRYGETDWISFKNIEDPDQIEPFVEIL